MTNMMLAFGRRLHKVHPCLKSDLPRMVHRIHHVVRAIIILASIRYRELVLQTCTVWHISAALGEGASFQDVWTASGLPLMRHPKVVTASVVYPSVFYQGVRPTYTYHFPFEHQNLLTKKKIKPWSDRQWSYSKLILNMTPVNLWLLGPVVWQFFIPPDKHEY